MNATTYGLDIAKRVFQMYRVDAQTREIVNRRFGRDELIGFLARRSAGRVALEACGGVDLEQTSPPTASGRSRREKRPFNSQIDSILATSCRLNFSAYEALRQLQQPYAG